MATPTRRVTAGESVTGGLESSSKRYRLRSKLTGSPKPEFNEERPYGAKSATASALVKESTESSIDGSTIVLAELVLFFAACFGWTSRTVVDGLNRYRTTLRTFGLDDTETLTVTTGSRRQAEVITGAVVTEIGISVSKNDTTASISGKLLGMPIDVDSGSDQNAVQVVAITGTPTTGTVTITVAGQTTEPIAYNATATDVQKALNTKLGNGYVSATGGPLNEQGVSVSFVKAPGVVAAATTTDTLDSGHVAVTVISTGDDVPLIDEANVQAGNIAIYVGTARPSLDEPLVNAASGFKVGAWDWNLSDAYIENHLQDGSGPAPTDFLPNVERKEEHKIWFEGDSRGIDIVRQYRAGNRDLYETTVGRSTIGGFIVLSRLAVSGIDDFGDKSGAFGFSATCTPVHDNEWGGPTQIQIDTEFDL